MAIYTVLLALAFISATKAHDGHGHHDPNHNHNSYDSGENKCDFYEEPWKIRQEGNSGKYEYYSSCNHDEHIILELETLTEMNQNGQETANKIHSFSAGLWKYGDMTRGHHHHHHHRPSVAVSENFYAGIALSNRVRYNLTTMIIEEDVEDFNILEKYNVTIKDGVNKWNVRFSDWPWLEKTNYLRLCVKVWIQGNAGESNITTYLENDLNHGYKIYHFHNHMQMHIPEYYKCGLNEQIANVDADILAYSKNDLLVCFNFDYCEDAEGNHTHIEYDPFVYFGSMVKEDYQQDIDPYVPFIYTTPLLSTTAETPCGGKEFVVTGEDEWTLDLYSLLIGIGIGLVAALIIGLIICFVKRGGNKNEAELAESKNDGKSNKKSKEQQKKDKKRGFFTKVNSGDVDDD